MKRQVELRGVVSGKYFYAGGRNITVTHKFKNVTKNPLVSLVVDDLKSVQPWQPRFIKIFGTGDIVTRDGYVGKSTYIRITPERKTSWGLD